MPGFFSSGDSIGSFLSSGSSVGSLLWRCFFKSDYGLSLDGGGNVSGWLDRKGNSTWSATGNAPSVSPEMRINGKPVLKFDTTNAESAVISSFGNLTATQHYLAFVWAPLLTDANTHYFLDSNQSSNRINASMSIQTSGPKKYATYDGTTLKIATNALEYGFRFTEFHMNGTAWNVYENGSAVAGGASTSLSRVMGTSVGFGRTAASATATFDGYLAMFGYAQAGDVTPSSNLTNTLFSRYAMGTELIFDGDSYVAGGGSNPPATNIVQDIMSDYRNYYYSFNSGHGSHRFSDMETEAQTQIDTRAASAYRKPILIVWCGYNDAANLTLAPGDLYNSLTSYIANRRAVKAFNRVLVVVPPAALNSGVMTDLQVYRDDLLSNLEGLNNSGIDLVDTWQNSVFSQSGCWNNTTYYQTDTIHLTQSGNDLIRAMIKEKLNLPITTY